MSHGEVDVSRGHQGAEDLTVNRTQTDFRVSELADRLLQTAPLSQNHTFLSDPLRTAQLQLQRLGSEIQLGKVLHAVPTLNWYKVQTSEAGAVVTASALCQGSWLNLGVRDTGTYGPNSAVLLFMPRGLSHGFILGAVPHQIAEGEVNICEWLVQGGNSGYKREDAHTWPIKTLFRHGGVQDFSNRRPVDATAWEWGKMSESGIGILIDSFQAFLRVSEVCGLFLNFWDNYTRLAGVNYDFQSNVLHDCHRYDEGENQRSVGHVIFPWEGVGCYDQGTPWTHEFGDTEVHYELPKGKIDLKDDEEDLQPVHRFVEYGGYLGQPFMRILMAPEKTTGKRRFRDEDKDRGLWQESLALDGAYMMRSAKSVFIGHRVLIPCPKQKCLPEDIENGDDLNEQKNYRFSGVFGEGDEHKIKDLAVEGEETHLRRVAGVLDILSFSYNWKSVHPFHYHANDYKLFQESELIGAPFDRVQDKLDFSELSSGEFMSHPEAKQLKVDKRYGDVNYYQRESFFCLHEDGSVQLACGYGSQISFVGGNLIFDTPGNIMFLAGKRVVSMGWDVVTRAKNSVDISASEKDVRIKAEKNLHVLAGNGGTGGMLFECKAEGYTHTYKDLYGEDVGSTGIVFLTKKSQVGLLAKDIYLRTGGGEIEEGDITLDASKGNRRVALYGMHVDVYAKKALQIWHEPADEDPKMTSAHRFAKDTSIISGNVIMEKNVVVLDGNLLVRKSIGAGKHVLAGKVVFQEKSIFVMPHGGQFDPNPNLDDIAEGRKKFVKVGDNMFNGDFKSKWYADNSLGNEDLLTAMGFSYRDPPSGSYQYRTDTFKMPEPRWMQMVRTGMATGGNAWTEKPVIYQGQDTYPFPGKAKWKDEQTLLCYKEHQLFDAGQGTAEDRAGPYEAAKLGEWDLQQPDGNFKTVL